MIRVEDIRPAHFAALKSLVDFEMIAGSRLRFAHDALFGVGAGCFDEILRGTSCRVITLNGQTERDGILAGLMLLELLAYERKSIGRLLAELSREFGPHCDARIDTRFPLDKRRALMEYCGANPPGKLLQSPVARIGSCDGVKFTAENGNWLMLRGSGTEPTLRIYAEASSDDDARALLRVGTRLTTRVWRI